MAARMSSQAIDLDHYLPSSPGLQNSAYLLVSLHAEAEKEN